ncbi:kinesin-like protein subito isoform X2 [Arctopsyche grandis]
MSYTDTTGSTDRSTTSTTNEICSFLEPRDPSITKPWMRPHPTEGKNLCDLFEDECSLDNSEINDQHLRVYLRVKPTKNLREQCYCVQSKNSFVMYQNKSNKKANRVKQIFNFTHIFDELNNTQIEVYERLVKNNLTKFIDGQDFTILTYGASGSGKTYSLMGTDSEPGIIPRFLEDLFSRIDIDKHPNFKPSDGNTIIKLSVSQKEKEIRNTQSMNKNNVNNSEIKDCLETYRRMSTVLIEQNGNWPSQQRKVTKKYDVWVSFAEIYNDAIFDLLREDPAVPNQPPPRLRLIRAANNQQYIKGIRWVYVRDGAEAYAALQRGKCRLHYAHTNINKQSSRSHSIFFLRIVHYNSDFSEDTYLSTFRLCDLAGSERAKKTGNEGMRLTESRMINSSLSVLERCLASLRIQQDGQQSLPPYRESKLTSLLQNALSGNEAISMMVNINPDPLFFDETHHVLQFSAIAKEIVRYVEPKLESFRRSRSFSDVSYNSFSETMETSFDENELQFLRDEIERNKKEFEIKLQQKERDLRKELVDKFIQMNHQKDMDYEERLKKDRERHAKFHEDEIDYMQNKHKKQLEVLNTENNMLKNQVLKLEKELQEKNDHFKASFKQEVESFYSEKCTLTESMNSEKQDSVRTNSFHSIHNSDLEENIKSTHSDTNIINESDSLNKSFITSLNNVKNEIESPKCNLTDSAFNDSNSLDKSFTENFNNIKIEVDNPKCDITNSHCNDRRSNSTSVLFAESLSDNNEAENPKRDLTNSPCKDKQSSPIKSTSPKSDAQNTSLVRTVSSHEVFEAVTEIKNILERIEIESEFDANKSIISDELDSSTDSTDKENDKPNDGDENMPLNVCFKNSLEILPLNSNSNNKQENITFTVSPKSNRENIPFNIENFCTVKKGKPEIDLLSLNGISSITKSKRKLFCRREFDENAAENVQHLKSTRHLDFNDDSPGTLQPPKINKPYIVEQTVRRSSRKKTTKKIL